MIEARPGGGDDPRVSARSLTPEFGGQFVGLYQGIPVPHGALDVLICQTDAVLQFGNFLQDAEVILRLHNLFFFHDSHLPS